MSDSSQYAIGMSRQQAAKKDTGHSVDIVYTFRSMVALFPKKKFLR